MREFVYVTLHTGDTKDKAFGNPETRLEERHRAVEDYPTATTHPKGYKSYVRMTKVFEPDPDVEKLIPGDADFVGTYRPSRLDQQAGDVTPLGHTGWCRELKLKAGSSAEPRSVVQMWTVNDDGSRREWQTVWTSGNDPVKGISALFVQRAADGRALYSILSEIHYLYTPGGDRVVEHAKGKSAEGTTPAESWSAVFTWTQAGKSK